MIIGRGITSFDAYAVLPRTGRGTPLYRSRARGRVGGLRGLRAADGKGEAHVLARAAARRARSSLRDGRASLRYDAVVADEAQDLGAAAVQMLAETRRGLPSPNLTLVGDGQQAIYPGGFSLLQMGIDVRGRATVLRTNWRNTYAIWVAAQAFIEGEEFDDLEEELAAGRDVEESPLPMRDGIPPGLWVSRRRRRGRARGRDRPRGARARRRSRRHRPCSLRRMRRPAAPLGAQPDPVPNRELSRYEGVHEPSSASARSTARRDSSSSTSSSRACPRRRGRRSALASTGSRSPKHARATCVRRSSR